MLPLQAMENAWKIKNVLLRFVYLGTTNSKCLQSLSFHLRNLGRKLAIFGGRVVGALFADRKLCNMKSDFAHRVASANGEFEFYLQ